MFLILTPQPIILGELDTTEKVELGEISRWSPGIIVIWYTKFEKKTKANKQTKTKKLKNFLKIRNKLNLYKLYR